MMTERENLLRAVRRDSPAHVPYCFSLCESQERNFRSQTGSLDYMEYFRMPFRYVEILPTTHRQDYSMFFRSLPEKTVIDEWGVAHEPSGMEHFTRMHHPMAGFISPRQVLDFPMPDVLADYRWEGFGQRVSETKARGLAAVYSAVQIFEPAWYLRGLENLLLDMLSDDEMALACLDRMTGIQSALSARAAAGGVDIIVFGDDVGTQKGMMMNPELWRKWLKPGMKAAIAASKAENPDVVAYYHSDGVIYDIIPDLIEIGVDVLNPVQPECMDPALLKMQYGGRLSFWGTIGTQTTMPFGTPADVEDCVKRVIDTVGRGGGLVVAPTHLLEPEVPWENILALVRAVEKYGRY